MKVLAERLLYAKGYKTLEDAIRELPFSYKAVNKGLEKKPNIVKNLFGEKYVKIDELKKVVIDNNELDFAKKFNINNEDIYCIWKVYCKELDLEVWATDDEVVQKIFPIVNSKKFFEDIKLGVEVIEHIEIAESELDKEKSPPALNLKIIILSHTDKPFLRYYDKENQTYYIGKSDLDDIVWMVNVRDHLDLATGKNKQKGEGC